MILEKLKTKKGGTVAQPNTLSQEMPKSGAQQFRDQAESTLRSAGESAKEVGREVNKDLGLDSKMGEVRALVSDAKDKVQDVSQRSFAYFSKHPVMAVATGAFAGVVLGLLMRRK
ncbi:MAG: hypothetical protein C5B49_03660 [Bdellovibrio sp.]|nr:MAG: hypothetical protein C5B49_03660 [Bdellovibrio sp.]